jgi:hypothetical protein
MIENMNGKRDYNCLSRVNLKNLLLLRIRVGPEAFRAGTTSCYGSGSTIKMRLLAAPAPQQGKSYAHDLQKKLNKEKTYSTKRKNK